MNFPSMYLLLYLSITFFLDEYFQTKHLLKTEVFNSWCVSVCMCINISSPKILLKPENQDSIF